MSSYATTWEGAPHTIVPCSFREHFAVPDETSEVPRARHSYSAVHVLDTGFLDDAKTKVLVEAAFKTCPTSSYGDINVRQAQPPHLPADLLEQLKGNLAETLVLTGVAGDSHQRYRRMLRQVDFITCQGVAFHNDVFSGWVRSFFWCMALEVSDVEFVMPHAGVRVPLAPGRIIVFDPSIVHGLCRPADEMQAVPESFDNTETGAFALLGGELALGDKDWRRLGSPWRSGAVMARQGLLDATRTTFDERTGAILNREAASYSVA